MAAPMLTSILSGKLQISSYVYFQKISSMFRVCSYCSKARKTRDIIWTFDESAMTNKETTVLETNKETTVLETNKKPTVLETNKKTTVLDFVNNCDSITLRKVLEKNDHSFPDLDPMKLVSIGKVSRRFESLDQFQQMFNVSNSGIQELEKGIGFLKKTDNYGLGIKLNLSTEQKKAIKTVVAVDILKDKLTWTEETLDRKLVSVGCVQSFPFYESYNHIIYQKQAIEGAEHIPVSNMYLYHSNMELFNKSDLSSHQICTETLVLTLLNNRSNGQYPLQSDVNKVFKLMFDNFTKFYNFQHLEQLLSQEEVLEALLENSTSLLSGIHMTDEIREAIEQLSDNHNTITKCLLMSDMVCRCLTKKLDSFPRAYSVHRGI